MLQYGLTYNRALKYNFFEVYDNEFAENGKCQNPRDTSPVREMWGKAVG